MKNNKLTVTYIKEIIDYMHKYNIYSVTLEGEFKLFIINKSSPKYLHFVDLNDYDNDEPGHGVFGVDIKEFIENFKKSKYYKITICK